MAAVKRVLLIVLAAIVLVPILLLLLLSSTPKLQLDPNVTAIGAATPVKVHIISPHGVRRITARIEQNGTQYEVFDTSRPSRRLFFFGKHAPEDVAFTVGSKSTPALKDGKANLVVEATSNDFRGSTASDAREVSVATRPPAVSPDGAQHYINQGGMELVTYAPEGYVTESGVKVGPYTFRSFGLPGKPNERFSMFAFPWDLPVSTAPFVYATNPTGTQAVGHFWFKVFPKKFRKRDLEINDAFLNKVVNEIDPNGSGDLVARFLKINGEMRRQNNKTLADLRDKTEQRFLWSGPFLTFSNSAVESEFADVRSYVYKGKKIDQQVHLGFDLAKVKNTPIVAANDGKIVWAERLGIYGNCIVVDHGFGLQSIYGHLSRINVKVGDAVKKGQEMGLSGATGLAGGDHLHFSMQVDGVQINPIEWWDAHWIHDRILSKVPAQ
ncbi:MAG TPA: M23 family metallopeptidase [Bryobacteraceae bacterium]|nr:M23 family metallopeptidase [Bryobacteraceae bacterium]